jgi:hypothetical protein
MYAHPSFCVTPLMLYPTAGLTGFAIFVSISGIALSLFMLLVPVIYEKYDKFVRLARALKEVRVGFILTGAGATASFLVACVRSRFSVSHPDVATDSLSPFQRGPSLGVKIPQMTPTKARELNIRVPFQDGVTQRKQGPSSCG